MTSSGEVPDDAPDRPRADRLLRDDAARDPLAGPVGDPRDAWLREPGDELRYGGRLDVPADAPDPADRADPDLEVPIGAEAEDPDGRTWAVQDDARPLGERGVVLAPEPEPSTPASRRLAVTEPGPDRDEE